MRYKRNKVQKPKHIIPSDLIKKNQFEEVISSAKDKSELTNRDRYLYGYALLRTHQTWQAFSTLWPLAKKYPKIEEDCAILAAEIFQDTTFLTQTEFTEETLNTFFNAARHFIPHSQAYHILKQRLCNHLWEKKNYETLERILKLNKDKTSIENLGKLSFLQAKKKLTGNIAAFISQVLTSAASLILRNPFYHNDISDILNLFANELLLLFPQDNQKLAWDKNLFQCIVNYEIDILREVLELAVKDKTCHFDIIPTPGYLANFDTASQRMSESFLPWLAKQDKSLFEMYDAATYQATLWVLGGDHCINSQTVFKLIKPSTLNPYLRLALMLRSKNMKKSTLNDLVSLSEFKAETTHDRFKLLIPLTVSSMMDEFNMDLKSDCWQLLIDFYPAIKNPELKTILIGKTIYQFQQQYKATRTPAFASIKQIADKLEDVELKNQITMLEDRRKECIEFIDTIKKYKANFKNEESLRAHLTLITDTCLLLSPKLLIGIFMHVGLLHKNARINKLIPLKKLVRNDFFQCRCPNCVSDFLTHEIFSIAEQLKLPIVKLPDAVSYTDSQLKSDAQIPLSSLLLQPNPFQILGVAPTDPKPVIMQKVMKLIQQSPTQMAMIRQAQHELFHPARRFIHHYLRFLAYDDINMDTVSLNNSTRKISFRQEFLNA